MDEEGDLCRGVDLNVRMGLKFGVFWGPKASPLFRIRDYLAG